MANMHVYVNILETTKKYVLWERTLPKTGHAAMALSETKMMDEDPMDVPMTSAEPEEIPDDTPHFLNPRVLNQEEAASQEKMVRINKETGEVTMSFKLPGWG